jgi:hypothetical protein
VTSSRPPHARMAPMNFAGSASSALPVPGAQAAPCVLDRLVPERPRAHVGRKEATP